MNNIKRMRNERGFTLIELLVVIVILGILAAVVVFAISGLTDKGEGSSCKIDTRTIRTAEEALYANKNSPASYGTEQELVDGGFLSELSSYHDVVIPGTADYSAATGVQTRPYDIVAVDAKCGTGTVGAQGSTAQ